MSEENVPETGEVSVDDVLAAIQQKNLGQARSHFEDLMGAKVSSALEAEKVNVASSIFNQAEEESEEVPEEDDFSDLSDDEEEETSFEDDVAAAFEEEDV